MQLGEARLTNCPPAPLRGWSYSAHGVEQARDDLIRVDAVGLGLKVDEDAVPQHRQRDGANIFERDDAAALEERAAPSRRGAAPARRAVPRPSAPTTGRTPARRPSPARPAASRAPAASRSRRRSRPRAPRGRRECSRSISSPVATTAICGSASPVVAVRIRRSSSADGYSITTLNMNRSSCASGSG